MPYDIALSLPADERRAQAIIFQEFQGRDFDVDAFRFKDPA